MDYIRFFSLNTVVLSAWIASIVCFSLDDAVYDKALAEKSSELKAKSKKWKIIGVGIMLASIFALIQFDYNMIARFVFAYPLLWFAGFYDVTYNLARGLSWNYFGTTSGLYSKYRLKAGAFHFMVALICIVLGVALFYMNGSLI